MNDKSIKYFLIIIIGLISIMVYFFLWLLKQILTIKSVFFDECAKSEHFLIYYCLNDKKIVTEIINYLETNYQRITSDLNQDLKNSIVINIYPNMYLYNLVSKLNKEKLWLVFLGMFVYPKWKVGYTDSDGIIHVVSPLNSGKSRFKFSDMMKIILHEVIHVIYLEINPNITFLNYVLSEGIAQYESKQECDIKNINIIPKSVGEMMLLYKTDDVKNYSISYSFTKFIIENFGYKEFISIYKKSYNIKNLDDKIENIYKVWVAKIKNSL